MGDLLDEELLKKSKLKPTRIQRLPILVWGLIWGVGVLFKLMEWPSPSSFIILFGSSGFIAFVINNYFRVRDKDTLNYKIGALALVWMFCIIRSHILKSGFFFFNSNGLIVHAALLILIFAIYRLADVLNK